MIIDSIQMHSMSYLMTMTSLDSLLLMVMEPYMELYKVIIRKFYKELLYSCLKSMEEEVSLQSVLPESEKKRDITTLEKLQNSVHSTLYMMTSLMYLG